MAALDEERKALEVERMRIIAEAEKRQQAIDEERRRLDTARQELARLHEERLSAVLADRDSAYQQVREAIA